MFSSICSMKIISGARQLAKFINIFRIAWFKDAIVVILLFIHITENVLKEQTKKNYNV